MKNKHYRRMLIYLWLAGFSISFLIQSLLQSWIANVTIWGRSSGWQNEIALWNIGMIGVVFALLRAKADCEKPLVWALAMLSFLLGLNHLYALAIDPTKYGHWLGSVLNFLVVILAFLSFTFKWREK